MIPASDKGSRCRRACFDSMPNSWVSTAVVMTGRRSRRSAIGHTAESLRAVILSFHSARMACNSLTSSPAAPCRPKAVQLHYPPVDTSAG